MALIWLEPISQENHTDHSDPIKLRRPLLISEFRIAKPQSVLFQVEFLAKDLRMPLDDLVTIERVERVEPTGNDMVIKLSEPILTNFLVIKGEYKSLTLCLEASEATLNTSKITIKPVSFIQTEEEIELLMISPLEFHGLFRYWIDFEENGEITSIRYLFGDFTPPKPAEFLIKKASQENVNLITNEIESLAQCLTPGTGYLTSLEKLGGLVENTINFYNAGHDSVYSGLRKLADSKLPISLVKIAICALEGNLHGLMEAKAALTLITHLLELPRLAKIFLESSGLSHLLLLVTHPSSSSQLILRVISAFHELISIPENSAFFFTQDSTQGLDPKLAQAHFTFPKKARKDELKKIKTEEENFYKTGYQIMLGLLNEKKTIKVSNSVKVLLNKCGLFYQLQKFNSNSRKASIDNGISSIEAIRRNLKLHMLRSSSHALPSVKHDLHTFLLLDSGTSLGNLQASAQFLSQPILTNSLADWLSYTNFLPNLLSLFLSQTSNLEDYRIGFINISDILLMLIRSQGGFGYITANADAVTGFIHAFQGLVIPTSNEEADFNILEEEYLLSTVTIEKIPSYSRQLALILSSILKFSEQLNSIKNGETLVGLNSLYAYLSIEDTGTIIPTVFYTIIRFQTDLLV